MDMLTCKRTRSEHSHRDENNGLKRRFGIRAVPSVFLFREGMFFQYNLKKHSPSNLTEILEFAKTGFRHSSANRGLIPEEVAFLSKLRKMLMSEIGDASLLSIALMKDAGSGKVFWKGIIVVYILPMCTLLGILFIKCRRKGQAQVETIEAPVDKKE